MKIRWGRLEDKEPLYKICLETGDSGSDASAKMLNKEIYGDIWVGPYLSLIEPSCLVLEDGDDNLIGYCLGAQNSRDFEEYCESYWWPQKRLLYPTPAMQRKEIWSRDEELQHLIHHPRQTPPDVYKKYPSHAHINLLSGARGQGWGRNLMESLENEFRRRGSCGMHLTLSASNLSALAFYRSIDYEILYQNSFEITVVKQL